MCTETTRPKYGRRTGRYASDLTDAEFALIEPLLSDGRRLGRPRTTGPRQQGGVPRPSPVWQEISDHG